MGWGVQALAFVCAHNALKGEAVVLLQQHDLGPAHGVQGWVRRTAPLRGLCTACLTVSGEAALVSHSLVAWPCSLPCA